MEKFRKLKLGEGLMRAIKEEKFEEPSEIQEKTIPLVLEGKDVIGSSSTGSGKTLAFGAGIIEKVKKGQGIQALILTPTRELAEQVTRHLRVFSRYHELTVKEICGGVAIEPQIKALSRGEIIVGTPGRILDLLNRRALHLEKIKFLVLDEADKMLEMGFIEDVQKIINECPKERQTLLFSATISRDIEHLAKRYMKNPVYVETKSYVDSSKLQQIFYDVPQNLKFSLLVHLLKQEKSDIAMVFCNTRRNTDMVAQNLKRHNIQALAIHGGLSQNKRNSIMKAFHSQQAVILVCTDVAARGLDIKDISHIYNYDSSKTSTEYIHRIGRTARAGKDGIAINLVSARDYENFRKVCEDDSLKIREEPVPELEQLHVNFNASSDRYSERGNYRSGGNSYKSNDRGSRGGGSRGESRGGSSRGRSQGDYSRSRSGGSRNGSSYSSGRGSRNNSQRRY